MFISHFNRYFEKHAKATYLVLLIVIIATFVIFVTPGSLGGGPARLKDFGKMYGKTLGVEKMQKGDSGYCFMEPLLRMVWR